MWLVARLKKSQTLLSMQYDVAGRGWALATVQNYCLLLIIFCSCLACYGEVGLQDLSHRLKMVQFLEVASPLL